MYLRRVYFNSGRAVNIARHGRGCNTNFPVTALITIVYKDCAGQSGRAVQVQEETPVTSIPMFFHSDRYIFNGITISGIAMNINGLNCLKGIAFHVDGKEHILRHNNFPGHKNATRIRWHREAKVERKSYFDSGVPEFLSSRMPQ
jgi:hypothetical protein